MRLLDENAQVTAGRVIFDDVDLLRLSEAEMRQIRGKRIAMVFQDPATALNPLFTIGQQIKDVLRAHSNLAKPARQQQAVELLASVGLPEPGQIVNVYPHQLSGGQQQRAMIALSLAGEPEAIHRRRTDDRAGRDDTGADSRSAAPAAAGESHKRHFDYA